MKKSVVALLFTVILVCFYTASSAKPVFGLGGHATYITLDDSKTIPNLGGAVETKATVGGTLKGHLDFAEKRFWRYFATELALDFSLHNVRAKNTLFGDLNAGKVGLLTTSWSLLWMMLPSWNFSPYLGFGASFVEIMGSDRGAIDNVKYTSNVGALVQAGFKFYSSRLWSIDFDIKKIAFFEDRWRPTVTLTKNGITGKNDNSINPLIVGLGAAFYFR